MYIGRGNVLEKGARSWQDDDEHAIVEEIDFREVPCIPQRQNRYRRSQNTSLNADKEVTCRKEQANTHTRVSQSVGP